MELAKLKLLNKEAAMERARLEQLEQEILGEPLAKQTAGLTKQTAGIAKQVAGIAKQTTALTKQLTAVSSWQVDMLVRNAALEAISLIAKGAGKRPSDLARMSSERFFESIPPQLRELPRFQHHFYAATRYVCGRYSPYNSGIHPDTWQQFVSRVLPDIVKARERPEWETTEDGLKDTISCLDYIANCAKAMATAEEDNARRRRYVVVCYIVRAFEFGDLCVFALS